MNQPALTALANDIRRDRRELRRQISSPPRLHSSMAVCAAALRCHPATLRTVPVWTILGWVTRIQDRHIRALLAYAGIASEYRMFGALTDRQVTALRTALLRPDLLPKEPKK